MGGIPTNHFGEVLKTNFVNGGDEFQSDEVVKGLFAAGEAACASVHGANRLGANSLLDIVVFGRATALHIAKSSTPGQKKTPLPKNAGLDAVELLDRSRYADGAVPTADLRLELQRTMQRDAAVYRTQESLEDGVRNVDNL